MPRYRFEALDESGARKADEVVANSPEDAFARLEVRGISVESLQEVTNGSRRGRELSREEVAEFAQQIAGLAHSGLPIQQALRALGEELPSKGLKRVFAEVASDLEAGKSLEKAISSESHRFPPHIRGLMLAGTRTGRLGEILSEYTQYDDSNASLRRKLWLSLSYPLMLVIAASTLFVILAKFVVLDFAHIFKDFGIELPFMTVGLIKAATAINKAGPWLVVGPLLALGAIWTLEHIAMGPAQRRRLAFEMPLFGDLWKWSSLSEYSHLLGLLLDSELPLTEALPLAGEGAQDPALTDASRFMAADIEAGESLATAVAQRQEFPYGYAQILAWAELHQTLPDALHMAGDIYEARARAQAAFVGTAFSIATVVFVISGVVYVNIALFYPMLQLLHRLAG
jgi:type II secretory pathway component PulF